MTSFVDDTMFLAIRKDMPHATYFKHSLKSLTSEFEMMLVYTPSWYPSAPTSASSLPQVNKLNTMRFAERRFCFRFLVMTGRSALILPASVYSAPCLSLAPSLSSPYIILPMKSSTMAASLLNTSACYLREAEIYCACNELTNGDLMCSTKNFFCSSLVSSALYAAHSSRCCTRMCCSALSYWKGASHAMKVVDGLCLAPGLLSLSNLMQKQHCRPVTFPVFASRPIGLSPKSISFATTYPLERAFGRHLGYDFGLKLPNQKCIYALFLCVEVHV